ncbi:hypothetical protein K2173_005616 [Erythroxylum novogranatense]|uniref:WRC domain-containing protein n=1 Tax=Erythroxylum novogranatense TaxID=1862640 RepID=A0AAV8SR87_9ROSI|nr:hypothetical protein K2173_005616 [Erythroxylum novogranatense]
MRIRNRKVPLPLSSLSPIPLSDPQLNSFPVVQLHLSENPLRVPAEEDEKAVCFDPHPSDQPIGGCFGSNTQASLRGKKQQVEEHEKGYDTRNIHNGRIPGAIMENEVLHQSSSSSRQGISRWFEGETKAFPLKKRRGSSERRSSNEETTGEEDRKMNKKCMQQNGIEEELGNKEIKKRFDGSAKRKSRGGALMEGSRCSRVNGRGWRCCQQTLVGYSLCEHHLGKGRLRSMNSVRSQSIGSSSTTALNKDKKSQVDHSKQLSSLLQEKEGNQISADKQIVKDIEEEVEERNEMMTSKKRKKKVGIVKARSISSLLG